MQGSWKVEAVSDNKPIIITFLVVLLAIAGLISWFYVSTESEESVTEEISVPPPSPVVPAPEPEPATTRPEPVIEEVVELPEEEPEIPAFVLPLLDESDQLIRDGVVSLTRHEGINLWLSPNQLIRKFVAFVDNIAHGQVAREPVRALAPEGEFLAQKISDDRYELDPASYSRYDLFTEIVISVDARRAAEFYHLLRPLMQKAYGELGYGNRSFDDVVFQAIGRLLETPVVEGTVYLVRPVVMYKFEDEKLEGLSAAQKQMIRMGPRNTRLLRAKISEVALELRAILEK
jgi:hypothetical protein